MIKYKKQMTFIFLISYFLLLNFYLNKDIDILGEFRTKSVLIISTAYYLFKFGFKNAFKSLCLLKWKEVKFFSITTLAVGVFISFLGCYQLFVHGMYKSLSDVNFRFFYIAFSPFVLALVFSSILLSSSFVGVNDAHDNHS